MSEVYSWASPSGHQVPITLEAHTPAVRVIRVDIGAGDRFAPEPLAIGPVDRKLRH